MRALWHIMSMLAKSDDDKRRLKDWKTDYANAGGGTVDPAIKPSVDVVQR